MKLVTDVAVKLKTDKYTLLKNNRTKYWVEIVPDETKMKMVLDKQYNDMMERNRKETENNFINSLKREENIRSQIYNEKKNKEKIEDDRHEKSYQELVKQNEQLNDALLVIKDETSQRSKLFLFLSHIVVGVISSILSTIIISLLFL